MKKQKWIMTRKGEVVNIFDNREDAVKYFIELLIQTLNDFEKQNKPCEFDYSFIIPQTEFKPVLERESFLSLI